MASPTVKKGSTNVVENATAVLVTVNGIELLPPRTDKQYGVARAVL